MARSLAVIILLLPLASARAEVTCAQLVAISEKTIDLRNQGASLPNLIADTEDRQMKSRFTPTELEFIRLLIRESFIGAYSPYDVNEACQDGRLSIPVKKAGESK